MIFMQRPVFPKDAAGAPDVPAGVKAKFDFSELAAPLAEVVAEAEAGDKEMDVLEGTEADALLGGEKAEAEAAAEAREPKEERLATDAEVAKLAEPLETVEEENSIFDGSAAFASKN